MTENQNNKDINIDLLNSLISSKEKMHFVWSKIWYLPDLESKACCKRYLFKYTENPIKILSIKRKDINTLIKNIPCNYNVWELVELFEKFLSEKNTPLGLPKDKLPNKDWLLTMIYHIDSENTLKVFDRKPEEQIITRKINNEKYFFFLFLIFFDFY